MDILLQKKNAYPWYTANGVSVRGYFQSKMAPDTIYRDASAVAFFEKADCFNDLVELLKMVDGVFALVIVRENTVWAAVDRARSMPLYYAENGSALSDDSKCLRSHLGIEMNHTDPLRMAELMTTGAVSDCWTVYSEIRQLPMATAAEWKNATLHTELYYRHMAPIKEYSRQEAKEALRRTAEKTIDDILRVVGDRPIVLSLSGGYDSRFVACMLKERGAKQVYCYTYGDRGSFEIEQSKKVADALGYPWNCVTYTEKDIVGQLDAAGQSYIDACYQHDFITYLQNYVAVKQLHEQGWFPSNAVFITGLCHDMPTGAYQKPENEVHYSFTPDGVAEYVMNARFVRYHLRKEAARLYLADLRQQIDRLGREITSFQDFVQVADALNTGFDHSRRFLAMNHSHEFFGYEWLLPCWNQELLDFWYGLPYTLRIQQNLYEEWLMEDLCGKYGVGTRKEVNQHTPFSWLTACLRLFGGILAYCCFKTHTPLRLRTNINGGAELSQKLYDGISQKQAIKYSRASQQLLLGLYFMEQRYGTNFWAELRKILRK